LVPSRIIISPEVHGWTHTGPPSLSSHCLYSAIRSRYQFKVERLVFFGLKNRMLLFLPSSNPPGLFGFLLSSPIGLFFFKEIPTQSVPYSVSRGNLNLIFSPSSFCPIITINTNYFSQCVIIYLSISLSRLRRWRRDIDDCFQHYLLVPSCVWI